MRIVYVPMKIPYTHVDITEPPETMPRPTKLAACRKVLPMHSPDIPSIISGDSVQATIITDQIWTVRDIEHYLAIFLSFYFLYAM